MEFAGIKPGSINKRLEDVFKETLSYTGSADTVYYETYETYKHKEDGFNFDYKYVIRTSDFSEGDHDYEELLDTYQVELFLVVSPDSLDKDVYEAIADNMSIEEVTCDEIVDYGLGVLLGAEELSASNGDARGMLNTVATVLAAIDMTRGMYLDKPWNRVGNTGWDLINKCLFNEDY